MGDKAAGLARVASKETSNQSQGRSGAETKKLGDVVGTVRHNPTHGGGINRATKGKGAGS
jgi:hypothetical protein